MERLAEHFEMLKKIDLSLLETKIKKFELEEISPRFITMYENYTKLENEPDFFNTLPEKNKETIKDNLSAFVEIAREIRNLKIDIGDIADARIELIKGTTDSYQNSYNFIRDFDIYLIKKQSREAESALETIRGVSAEKGISRFAGFLKKVTGRGVFGNQSTINSLIAFIFLLIGIGIACFIYKDLQALLEKLADIIENNSKESISFQVILIRIVIISFLTFIFYQVIRIFSINMHLYTVNKHRSHVLETYRLLVGGTGDQKTKDEILMQAIKTIFEPGDTGYLSSKDNKVPLLEIIKMIEKSDKTS